MKGGKVLAGVMVAATVVGGAVALAGWASGGPRGDWGRGPWHGDGPGMRGLPWRALDNLDLTAEQRSKIQSIVDQAQPTIAGLREQLRSMRQSFRAAQAPGTVDEAAIRAEMARRSSVHADLAVKLAKVRAEIYAVLTPEQQKKLADMREQWQSCAGARRGGWRR